MSDVAVILAAGMGTRMRSKLAKVLHPLLGVPMVAWVSRAAADADLDVVAVVNHQEPAVRAALGPGVRFARQAVPRGTGDAVTAALTELPEGGTAVVLSGDAPLVRASTIRALLAAHRSDEGRLATVLTVRMPDPAAYGRLVRDSAGAPLRIVEANEATPTELAIDEINAGIYAFDIAWLRRTLPGLPAHRHRGGEGEIYLTDVIERASDVGAAGAFLHRDTEEVAGINDRWALAQCTRVLQQRILEAHASNGVTFDDPDSVRVDASVRLAADTRIGRGAVLTGQTSLDEDVEIGPYAVLHDTTVARGAVIHSHSHCEGAAVGPHSSVGPFARLRAGAHLDEDVKVGNFVEVKQTRLQAGVRASHLSYLGDADVGAGANVGAGTITCNYDGYLKHKTEIGAGAFIGSNTALVAPVRIGAGAIVGAGAVILRDVPADAIAVARGEQVERPGAAPRFRARRAELKAALAAGRTPREGA